MNTKKILTVLLLSISFLGYSQYNYEIKLLSLKSLHPKVVLNDIAKKTEIYNKRYDDDMFYFSSKIRFTEERFNEIVISAGYSLEEFKLIANKEEEKELE
jgi:hypothetical protein